MRAEHESIRLNIKVFDEQLIYLFENILKRVFGPENVEIEPTRENKLSGFGNFYTYIHICYPEGGPRW